MFSVCLMTLKGIFRDRVFQGIITLAVLFVFIPSAASLSMRQVTELSITLSLSLISFILLLLAVFLGATSLWKDIERRYSFSVLSLPISRTAFLLGRFTGIAVFLVVTSSVLGASACAAIKAASTIYPSERPIVWTCILLAIVFATFKYILLVGVALLLSTVCTSFFLPIFGTVCVFLASSISQQVYDYVNMPSSEKFVSPVLKVMASVFYYVIPNFAAFDLKINAIYSIVPQISGLALTSLYFVVYTVILLGAAALLFERREMK